MEIWPVKKKIELYTIVEYMCKRDPVKGQPSPKTKQTHIYSVYSTLG